MQTTFVAIGALRVRIVKFCLSSVSKLLFTVYSGIPKKKKSPGRPKKLKQEKITDHVTVKKRKHDRFKGMSEEEVAAKLLPDHLAPDLDIVIVSFITGLDKQNF